MKADTERKKYYNAKKHTKKKGLHAHLSKELRKKMSKKKRALLLHKGDKVQVMRGPGKGKTTKISKVNTDKRKVYLDGINSRTAKGKEVLVAIEPSNLMLLELEPTETRKKLFTQEAFKKEEKPKKKVEKSATKKADPPKPKEEKKVASPAAKPAPAPKATTDNIKR